MSTVATYSVVVPPLSGGGGGGTNSTGPIIPTLGQTIFNLASAPTNPALVEMDVNGASYSFGSGAFTLAGAVLTWTGGYTLDATDVVVITF